MTIDSLIKSDAGSEKRFLTFLRILVGILPGPGVLCVFSILRISLTSPFVVGDKKKQFLFEPLSMNQKI